jgi:hypothetical protein
VKVTFVPLAAALAAGILWGGHADAQVRVRGGVRGVSPRARVSVVVGRPYYYRPYYRSYYRSFYDPFYFDPFYRPYSYRPFYWYPYSQVGYGYGRFDGSAALRLQVAPRETEVYIDNYYAGTVDDFDGMFQRLHIEPGAHDVTLYHDGYRTVRQRVYIQPTGTFRLRYMMVPLGPGEVAEARPAEPPPAPPQSPPGTPSQAGPNVYPPPPYRGAPGQRPEGPPPGAYPPPPGNRSDASLSIRVQPGNAEVFIDGERWDGPSGDDRLVVQVAPGAHHVEVRREGYRTYQTDINARPGETTTVNISLTRQP